MQQKRIIGESEVNGLQIAALWYVVVAGRGFVFNADRHQLGFFLSQPCLCRDGRGKRLAIGKERGSSHGSGRRKMKGREKTNIFLEQP